MSDEELKRYINEHINDNYYDKKMLDNDNEFCSIQDLAKRFIEIDKEYNGEPWNLQQILANIRMTKYYSKNEIANEVYGMIKGAEE